MRGGPGGEPVRRLRTLLALAGLPAILLCLVLAIRAGLDGRAAFLAGLEARAQERHRLLEALLEGPVDAEAVVDTAPRDVAGLRERLRALAATLDGPAGTVRLVEGAAAAASEGPGGDADAALLLRRPIGASGLEIEHRVAAGAVRRAALAAAAPWLAAAVLLAATLLLARILIGRLLLAPAVAALDGLAAAAAGRAVAGAVPVGWASPWLEAGRRAVREQGERLAAAEAVEASLQAALEAVEEGVALLAADERVLLANAAFARALRQLGLEAPEPGRPLDPALRDALDRLPGLRALALASGGRLLLVPGPAAPPPEAAMPVVAPEPAGAPMADAERPARAAVLPPVARAGPRLAAIVQEVAEALARVAREAVLLHELAAEPATRARAERLRRAVERCTRAIAPLLLPAPPPRPDAVAVDRLLEGRLERLRARGVELLAGLAPDLPPVQADPDRLADLLDGLLLAAVPERDGRLRVRLRRAGDGLRLELERLGAEADRTPAGLALLRHRARELGATLALENGSAGGRVLRLDLPCHGRPPAVEPAPGRLLVVAGERGAGRGGGPGANERGPAGPGAAEGARAVS